LKVREAKKMKLFLCEEAQDVTHVILTCAKIETEKNWGVLRKEIILKKFIDYNIKICRRNFYDYFKEGLEAGGKYVIFL
jgi:hypothetical protein